MVQVLGIALLGHSEEALASRVSIASTVFCILRRLRVVLAREHKHLAHVVNILLAQLHTRSIGPRVRVALRQPKPARTKKS